jgi:hypothetical protein
VEVKSRCIVDFLRAAAFFLIIPLRAAESSLLIISLRALSASAASFFWASVTNFLVLVLTALFTALFRSRRSSLWRCRFSADVILPAKQFLRYLKSEGRRSTRLHFSHSAWFFTLPFSKTVFILTSPPQEQKNFWVALVVREFLLAWAIVFSS